MRANGEPNFPDPGSNGVIAIQGGGGGEGVWVTIAPSAAPR